MQRSLRRTSPCHFSLSQPWVGMRRKSMFMRASWKIWIPSGHGMQYPQLRQNPSAIWARSASMTACSSGVSCGVSSMYPNHSSSSSMRCTPQMGTTWGNWRMKA